MMKVLLTILVTSTQAFAAPNSAPNAGPGSASKEEIKLMYDVTCVPGSAGYDKQEAANYRAFMLELLQNPTPVLEKLKQDESFGGALALGLTCGVVVVAKEHFQKGCTRPDGSKLDATEAIRQCEEVVKNFKKQQNDPNGQEPQN